MKWLHIKCGFLDTEHVFMLPINWLNHHEFTDVNMYIAQNFYNANCTPKYFPVEEYFDSWCLKTHGSRNYLHSFYLASLID